MFKLLTLSFKLCREFRRSDREELRIKSYYRFFGVLSVAKTS